MLPPLPTGSETQSGVAAELLEHLERRRLLTLEPVRVDRVQERERAALDELAHEPKRVVEVALHRDHPRAADLGLGELPARDGALRQDDGQADAGPAAVGGRRRARCSRSTRTPPRVAPSSSAFETATVIPRSLNEPVGFAPSYFR